jgi:hypothetical protein
MTIILLKLKLLPSVIFAGNKKEEGNKSHGVAKSFKTSLGVF